MSVYLSSSSVTPEVSSEHTSWVSLIQNTARDMTSLSCCHIYDPMFPDSQLPVFPWWNLPQFWAESRTPWGHQHLSPALDIWEQSHQDCKNHSLFHTGVFTGSIIKPVRSPAWEARNIFSVLISEVGVLLGWRFYCKSQQVYCPKALLWPGQCLLLLSIKPSLGIDIRWGGQRVLPLHQVRRHFEYFITNRWPMCFRHTWNRPKPKTSFCF